MATRQTGPMCVSEGKHQSPDKGTNARTRSPFPGIAGVHEPAEVRFADKMCFAFYYRDREGSFKRAADTWAGEVANNIPVQVLSVLTLPDFRAKWNSLSILARATQRRYYRAALFLHGSAITQGKEDSRGLEFLPSRNAIQAQHPNERIPETYGGLSTGSSSFVRQLDKLPWARGAKLELYACMSGYGETPLASVFADAQSVDTSGQDGMALFSQYKDRYVAIDKDSKTVYLRAFVRKQNMAIKLLDGELHSFNAPLPDKRFKGSIPRPMSHANAQERSFDE